MNPTTKKKKKNLETRIKINTVIKLKMNGVIVKKIVDNSMNIHQTYFIWFLIIIQVLSSLF